MNEIYRAGGNRFDVQSRASITGGGSFGAGSVMAEMPLDRFLINRRLYTYVLFGSLPSTSIAFLYVEFLLSNKKIAELPIRFAGGTSVAVDNFRMLFGAEPSATQYAHDMVQIYDAAGSKQYLHPQHLVVDADKARFVYRSSLPVASGAAIQDWFIAILSHS